MDVIKYIGNPKYYEENSNSPSYNGGYFGPRKYPVEEKLDSLSDIPIDAVASIQVQSRFKSKDHIIQLLKHL